MGDGKKMVHCPSCDVYVGVCDGEMVVVTGDTFREYIAISQKHILDCGCKDSYSDELHNPRAWKEDAILQVYQGIWCESDDLERGFWWYRARGLEELHDHSLWVELMS